MVMVQPGIVYRISSASVEVFLPLEELRVEAVIVDVSAKVTLSQIYSNPMGTSTGRCKYVFPVPANAAIAAFSLKTTNGRKVKGVVKEKPLALEEYEEALRAGQFAGLVNYVTDDIFTLSVGAIPPHAKVEVHLEYVMSLSNDDNIDEVRFQLSRDVGKRYGTTPSELFSAHHPASHTRIRVMCEIQTSGYIRHIFSPSHPEVTETRHRHGGRDSRRRSIVNFRSSSFLDRDFILIVGADGLDSPRCFAEIWQDSAQMCSTLALQLTLVPKLCLPPIDTQEYLFVVDKSGSMGIDSRLATAKTTLNLLLPMLPMENTIFNIYIFDYDANGLWQRSCKYGQETLKDAMSYVDAMEAGGGTEIGGAMSHVLESRNTGVPTAVFVLTDGNVESKESNHAISVVEQAVKNAPQNAPLRVFVLGIGSGVSTATCDGMARAGHGESLYATEAENILGKCARLFNAGRTPFLRNVVIDWGLAKEYLNIPTATFSSQTSSPRTVEIPFPAIQQVPAHIQEIHAGTRMNVYAIITLEKDSTPREIVLRGELDNGGNPFVLRIPIRGVQLTGTGKGLPLIHTLSAWRLIQEHENGAPLQLKGLQAISENKRRANIVQLGKKYQLVSRYTSFIAVDSGQNDEQHTADRYGARGGRSSPLRPTLDGGAQRQSQSPLQSYMDFIIGIFGNITANNSRVLPGSWPDSLPSSGSEDNESRDENEGGDDVSTTESDGSAETFSTISSLASHDWSEWSATASPETRPTELTGEEEQRQNQSSPRWEHLSLAPEAVRQQRPLTRPQVPVPVGSSTARIVPAQVVNLVRLQSFDGSFKLDSIRHIVGRNAVEHVNNLNMDDDVWATALSVAFMRKKMGALRELLDDLLVKPLKFLAATSEVDINEVIRQADSFV